MPPVKDQQTQVKKILQELKDKKISASQVETDLKFASGHLWKVKDGRRNLSPENLEKLEKYHDKKINGSKKAVIKPVVTLPKKISVNKKQPTAPEKKSSLAAFLKSTPAEKKVYGEKYSRKKY